jgi:hypothetical protein
MRGTGTAPARGAAQTGTFCNVGFQVNGLGATVQVPMPFVAVVGGLTIGTPCWFDLSVTVSSGNVAYFYVGYSFLEV